MQIKRKLVLLLFSLLLLSVSIVAAAGEDTQATILKGTVFSLKPLANAQVTVFDTAGNSKATTADGLGNYELEVTELKAPLLIHAVEADIPNFSEENKLRGKNVAAILTEVRPHAVNTANVNPLSDRVVSDVAKTLGYKGPVGLVMAGKTAGISPTLVKEKSERTRLLVLAALKEAGVAAAGEWDAVTTPLSRQAVKVLELIRHNHGYDAASGQVGDTMLFDINFRPLSSHDVLNFKRAVGEKAKLADRNIVHIYLAADSTCSYYESERAPRAGWGQVFQSKFKNDAGVMVVNAAQSGRSSRTFINEGWLRMIEDSMLPGDYLFIQFGHNDEKGGSVNPASRDAFDIANTATYPNDAQGNRQGGDLSFQLWLEKYIQAARDKQAIPVLLTPTTRIVLNKDKATGIFPLERSVHVNTALNSGAKYLGDFSQTIRDTARANRVTSLDIDVRTIALANTWGEPGWKTLWLAVNPQQYPYYQPGVAGNIESPDNTHFQLAGASKVGDLVIEELRRHVSLAGLAKLAK